MSEPGKKIKTEQQLQAGALFSTTPLEVKSTHTVELVIALCGPIGSPLHQVGSDIESILTRDFDYTCNIIRLSEIIEDHEGKVIQNSSFKRVQDLITKGNTLRENYGKSILADFAISKISFNREKHKGSEATKFSSRRVCHVIDSIKNQEELEALRYVYGNILYFVGVFSPLPIREKNLKDRGMSLAEVYQLIEQDSGEEIAHGQTVRETFPQADFFLRVDSQADAPRKRKIKRFLDIIFGVGVFTPSPHETAMYLASSVAGNSSCLSRQVGAALTDGKGEVISVGWNDVPKYSGNLYQYSEADPSMENDHRCMNRDGGKCSNDSEKQSITSDIVNELIKNDVIEESKKEKAINVILSSKIKTLLEFSRSIHAEMHAIILGSQMSGSRVKGGKLFCTTYPCHSCARHIIASGIKEVYYIEPYRKSLAIRLHGDAITESESESEKVRILAFDGVAPTRYFRMFKVKLNSRKNSEGKQIHVDRKKATPICEVSLESLPVLEAIVVDRLKGFKLINIIQEE